MNRRKKSRPKRTYKHDIIADFQRLPPKQQRLFLQKMRRWLQRAGYALLLITTAYAIMQIY